jgi:hypothetical protein
LNKISVFLKFFKVFNNFLCIILQIISDYCKNVPQTKPFSHIMIEIFKRVIHDPNFGIAVNSGEESLKRKNQRKSKEDHR